MIKYIYIILHFIAPQIYFYKVSYRIKTKPLRSMIRRNSLIFLVPFYVYRFPFPKLYFLCGEDY